MKKILYSIIAMLGIFGTTACSDMLDSDSSRQLFDPALNQKTDSVFYAYGIMQAMQQLADQYYYQNEMRGDLVKPTSKATTHLRTLATFSADASNKYDSVYLYYKVINNCNYYLNKRDTTLATGNRKVAINEFVAIASFRAWTYLQLTRQYGNVPYITDPVTTINQINANTTPTAFETILAGEAQMLETLKARYTDEQLSVPTFNQTSINIGALNWGNQSKFINPRKCFIPINVVLGDIYLELGEYAKAAKCYYDYLRYAGLEDISNISVNWIETMSPAYGYYNPIFKNFIEWPADYDAAKNSSLFNGNLSWRNSFSHQASPGDVISYIPMAVNYTMGKTTDIPASYGFSYYGTERSSQVSIGTEFIFNCPRTEDIQIVPSQAYCDSARRAQYYYYTEQVKVAPFNWIVKNDRIGDARAGRIIAQGEGADSSYVYISKPSTAYILLYRNATVWLHLAEAINRMGYPDAAFAVLKNGLHSELPSYRYLEVYLKDQQGNDSIDENGNKVLDMTQSHIDDKYYLTPESYELLTTTLPFLSQANSEIFKNGTTKAFIGIHFHGAGAVEDLYSSYRYSNVLKDKLFDIGSKFPSTHLLRYRCPVCGDISESDDKCAGNSGKGTQHDPTERQPILKEDLSKEDYINAMEDLLCDEYAMEFAFEGTRFSDLRRLALHKNRAGTYGGNFGDTWFGRMLQNNASGITTQNCYLPYK